MASNFSSLFFSRLANLKVITVLVVTIIFFAGSISFVNAAYTDSPSHQTKLGIPIYEIQCRDNLNLVLRPLAENPVCIKSSTVNKMVERGGFVIHLGSSQDKIEIITADNTSNLFKIEIRTLEDSVTIPLDPASISKISQIISNFPVSELSEKQIKNMLKTLQYVEPFLKMEKSSSVDKDESFIDVKLDPILYSGGPISSNMIKSNTIKSNDTNIASTPAEIFPARSEMILSQLPRIGDVINATFVVTSTTSHPAFPFFPSFHVRDGLEFVNIPDDFELTYRESVRNWLGYYPGEYTLKGPWTSIEPNTTKSFTVQVRATSEGVNVVRAVAVDKSAGIDFVIGPTETLLRLDYYAKYPDEKPVKHEIQLPQTYEEQLAIEEKYDMSFGTTTTKDPSEAEFIVWLKEYVKSLSKYDRDFIDELTVLLKEDGYSDSVIKDIIGAYPHHAPNNSTLDANNSTD